MRLFSNKRTKRNTLWVVLVLWAFALTSGVANACLLESQVMHPHAVATESQSMPVMLSKHLAETAEHERTNSIDGAKDSCQKFCSDESKYLKKQYLGVDQLSVGLAPVVIVLWNLAELDRFAAAQREGIEPLPLTLPLRLRYSRLAL